MAGEEVNGLPAIGISMNIQLDKAGQRTIVFQTYVPQGSPDEVIDEILDQGFRTTTRATRKFFIVELQEALDDRKKNLKYSTEDMARVDRKVLEQWDASGRKGEPKLHGQEKTQRENAKVNVQRLRDEVEWFEKKIAELRSLTGEQPTNYSYDAGESGADREGAGADSFAGA